MKPTGWNRRDFLKTGVSAAGVAGLAGNMKLAEGEPAKAVATARRAALAGPGLTRYENETLPRVAFPMGGIGAGMICLEGTGALSNVSIRNRPDLFNEPCVFAAVAVKGSKATARVLEGPVPGWKIFGMPDSGLGEGEHTYGFPRFRDVNFAACATHSTNTNAGTGTLVRWLRM